MHDPADRPSSGSAPQESLQRATIGDVDGGNPDIDVFAPQLIDLGRVFVGQLPDRWPVICLAPAGQPLCGCQAIR